MLLLLLVGCPSTFPGVGATPSWLVPSECAQVDVTVRVCRFYDVEEGQVCYIANGGAGVGLSCEEGAP